MFYNYDFNCEACQDGKFVEFLNPVPDETGVHPDAIEHCLVSCPVCCDRNDEPAFPGIPG